MFLITMPALSNGYGPYRRSLKRMARGTRARAAAWEPRAGSMKLHNGSFRPVVVVIVDR